MVMKEIQNGYLEADRTKSPPARVPGYEAAFGDPYVFLPELPACDFRTKKLVVESCCGATEKTHCSELDAFVTREQCLKCETTHDE